MMLCVKLVPLVFYLSSFVALCEKFDKCNVVAEFVLCLEENPLCFGVSFLK